MFVAPQTDRLPHEPLRVRASTAPFLLRLVLTALGVGLFWLLTLGLWPPALLGILIWGWPPNQPRPEAFRRLLRLVWTARPPAPGIAPLSRAYLTVQLLNRLALLPVWSVAWSLDELLYGRTLDATPLTAPIIILSAARSGSTQISRYLESDPRLAAPAMMQCVFPFLWLWRLAAPTLGRVVPKRWPRALMEAALPEEFIQRHEGDPYHTDTFEVLFYAQHLNLMSFCLGPELIASDFGFARASAHSRAFWERDLVNFAERLGRKTVLFAGPGPDGQPKRLFFKGHFQAADDAMAARFPDARFVTVIRDPARRLQSSLNHYHANSGVEELGAVPWDWLVRAVPGDELQYCVRELDWFTRPDGPPRTVIRFVDYKHDLEGTMTRLYKDCFGDTTLPDYVPTEHAPRERKNYRVNRSLEELGVDAEAYAAQLADYRAWCQPGA